MWTADLYYKIDELKYSYSLRSPKILTVHKVLFEDELGDSIQKRKGGKPREVVACGPKAMPALAYLQGSLTTHHFIKEIKNQCDYEKNFFITAYVH